MVSRRRLWWPLVLGLLALVACGLSVFRFIGPWELGVVLVPVALVFVIEGGRYIVRQFARGYRRPPPTG
jgi:hypothetical protein